ncbi:undecaprenyl-diphosphate phosphatase [Sulfitobacter mediterraneus]|jgi:undecaprenyl-diphosphatase|uniref:undecaprenyl-diphosphate phosphatase n=1 Tax=Sulfitobacter TaxID=60136 RepID=UPI001931D6B8|nr:MULTISPECIES: undecaprenyl-diphosphate phosphatase [Sulfitobacter]MBM1633047.1 undecaprenyl-diphosphate phosphatase [Sulfitobacter mediterraneus]MBM1640819.1 undecaprenyl-diphosphate phosphatase [Sulfitobacter mediterraneus]MBM1644912.1 undecaprenyl-diphosphate phosphatase [Sulfitobacter mediterraneus]MBM1648939.1 undecaprenyl-diphosphate phosphatase [Sulfitobacter mediterraneus]MBM1652960.1 undecaprenyl-diphosphate phosphatase [Sulfitobacter mediterraneus]
MDSSTTLVAAFLGLVEGLTEFIPVSSTGHLLLAGHFLGFESAGKTFEVVIQLGAVLAILTIYAGRLWSVFSTAPHDPQSRRFILSVLIAFLPAVFIGVLAHDFIKTVLFETPMLIAIMLILGGFVLLVVDRIAPEPVHDDAMRFPLPMALAIGFIQCLAMIPGVSRSGATIVGALMLGGSKRAAAEFSFFLSMPTMAGAFAYDLYKNRDVLDASAMGEIAVGFAMAFVSAVLVVRWLLGYVSKHGYALFGWWRIVVGTAAFVGLLVFG